MYHLGHYDGRYDEDGKICLCVGAEYGCYYVGEWIIEDTEDGEPELDCCEVADYGAPEYLEEKFHNWGLAQDQLEAGRYSTDYELDRLCREFRAYLDPKYVLENQGGSWECPDTCPKQKIFHWDVWTSLKHWEFLEIKPHISGYCWKDGELIDGMDLGIPEWLDHQLTEWSHFHDSETQSIWCGEGVEHNFIKLASLARAYFSKEYGMLITAPGIDGIWVWPPHRLDNTYLLQFKEEAFTPEAESLWQERSGSDQKRILNDVWCPWCRMGTPIEKYSGFVNKDGDLTLWGACPNGHPLERVVKTHIS
jgi:hypothetical protein